MAQKSKIRRAERRDGYQRRDRGIPATDDRRKGISGRRRRVERAAEFATEEEAVAWLNQKAGITDTVAA